MLIDTHCHLTYPELAGQLEDVLTRARGAGVQRMITIATSPGDAQRALELVRADAQLAMSAGIHPHEAGRATAGDLEALAALHRHPPAGVAPRLLAVGETGLDFHYDFAPRERQEEVFRFQLELAREVGRPVVIHARESEARVCEVLADYPELCGRFVFHCFSGDAALAERVLALGGFVSFTGIVTFRSATAIQEAARRVPPERFFVETDAPYLAPEPVRKRRPNEPALVVHTARRLAELRAVTLEALASQTTRNAEAFFGWPGGDPAVS